MVFGKKGSNPKHGEVKDSVLKRKKEKEEKRVEMGRGRHRKSQGNKVLRIHNAKERRSRKTCNKRHKRAMIAV